MVAAASSTLFILALSTSAPLACTELEALGAGGEPGDSKLLPSALAGDDECAAGGAGGELCAQNALQRQALLAQRSASGTDASQNATDTGHPVIAPCNDRIRSRRCPKPLQCVTKPDLSWSQCVDCTSQTTFNADCILMDTEMRKSAQFECNKKCPYTTPKPTISGCDDSSEYRKCKKPLKCVTIPDGTYSQCMDCSGRNFYEDCQKWSDNVRHAAVNICNRTCLGTPCHGKSWCIKPYKCIGTPEWKQCIRCDYKTFHYDCHWWKEDFYKIVAKKCKRKCHHAPKKVKTARHHHHKASVGGADSVEAHVNSTELEEADAEDDMGPEEAED